MQSQEELLKMIEYCFDEKETIGYEDFKKIAEDKDSTMVICVRQGY
jgi:hypothetical protein